MFFAKLKLENRMLLYQILGLFSVIVHMMMHHKILISSCFEKKLLLHKH